MADIIAIFTMILLFLLISAGIYFMFLYKTELAKKDKISREIKKTLKQNIKKEAETIIPDDWLKNINSTDMAGFMENTVESKLSGNDINNFLSGLGSGNQNMFMQLISQMLTEDPATAQKLADKLGIPINIAKPILTMGIAVVSSFANKMLTNVLAGKFKENIKEKRDEIKRLEPYVKDGPTTVYGQYGAFDY